MASSILVVDDEPALRRAVERALAAEGYAVRLAADGVEALEALRRDPVDAVVLDVSMPRLDGLDLTKLLRGDGDRTPILMLTARAAVGDRVAGLEAGADDYLVKPFALEELLARVKALLRRSAAAPGTPAPDAPLVFADLRLDPVTYEVSRGARRIELTRTEHQLLELLLRHPRQVLPRELILERVWGYTFATTSNSLDVYIGYLRRKLEAEGEPRLLHTVRGVGYVLREP
jgi:two-component system response regulator MprA